MIFAPRDLSISLADNLVDLGHDVYFFATPDVQTKAHLMPGDKNLLEKDYGSAMLGNKESERLKWGYFYLTKYYYQLDLIRRCYEFSREQHVDIVHNYHDNMAHFFEGMVNIPTVYTLHDPLPTEEMKLNYWLLNTFKDHRYVSISNAFRRSAILQLNFVDTVYHGINMPQIKESGTYDYIAFMGRLIAEKGADTAIDVARELHIPIKLASSVEKANISDDAYYKTVIEPRIDPKLVTFTEFMNAQHKFIFLAGAKCFLFPIHWEEPFGMVMIEAMASGTPVVAYNRGSVSELVRDGVTGFIVDDDKGNQGTRGNWVIKKTGKAGLVEAIQRIGEIDRVACRKHVEDNFTPRKTAEGYVKAYEKVIHDYIK